MNILMAVKRSRTARVKGPWRIASVTDTERPGSSGTKVAPMSPLVVFSGASLFILSCARDSAQSGSSGQSCQLSMVWNHGEGAYYLDITQYLTVVDNC